MKFNIRKSKKHSNLSIIKFESRKKIKEVKVLTNDLMKPMFLTKLCESVILYFKNKTNEN